MKVENLTKKLRKKVKKIGKKTPKSLDDLMFYALKKSPFAE